MFSNLRIILLYNNNNNNNISLFNVGKRVDSISTIKKVTQKYKKVKICTELIKTNKQ